MIKATFEAGQLMLNLEQAPRVTSLQLQKWMTLFMARLHSAVVANIGNGGLIGRRSGNLARSIREEVTNNGSMVTGMVYPDRSKAIYGDINEDGGTIIPRRSKYLAIPLRAMMTASGVSKGSARDVFQNPSAFGYTGAFVAKSIIFGTRGRGKLATIIPLFVLKNSVTLPARRYMEQTLQQQLDWGMAKLEEITQETAQLILPGGAL